jgi:hypothetical protein
MAHINFYKQLSKYVNDIFIETGTYHGYITEKSCHMGFKRIITVELIQDYQNIAKKNCEGYNVEFYLGNSPEILNSIIPTIDDKITLFLDAHLDVSDKVKLVENGAITNEFKICPLFEELNAIKLSSRNDHDIFIDDIRCLNFWGLTLDDLYNKLREINSNYQFEIIGGESNSDFPDILLATLDLNKIKN